MDIQLFFRKQRKGNLLPCNPVSRNSVSGNSGSSGALQPSCAASTLPLESAWSHLREIKWRVESNESIDSSAVLSLRQQFRSAKRSLRLERREKLKQLLQGSTVECLKEATQLRSAMGVVEKALDQLNQVRRRRNSRKAATSELNKRQARRRRLGEKMVELAPQRQRLIEQREGIYQQFHRAMIQMPWLRGGWPLDPFIDERGQPIDARRSNISQKLCQSDSIRQALTALRQLEAQLDLYGLTHMPQEMNPHQWHEFSTGAMQTALNSLGCCHGGCGCHGEQIDERGRLYCKSHLASNLGIELPWVGNLCHHLSKLLNQ